MKKSIFLSYPRAVNEQQEKFIMELERYLKSIQLEPRTLGVTDYDYKVPLQTIRSLMFECNGLVNVSFKRYEITKGSKMSRNGNNKDISGQWFTSPYSQIEPAMAFQMGLPTLIIKEEGVIADGMLELGAMANYIPEFSLSDEREAEKFFKLDETQSVFDSWKVDVGEVYKRKGLPNHLY